MSSEVITLHGTLQADGTLALQGKPSLPPGPVEVTLRRLPSSPAPAGWLDYLQQARSELEAAGHPFRTKDAIDADLAELRATLATCPNRGRKPPETGRGRGDAPFR